MTEATQKDDTVTPIVPSSGAKVTPRLGHLRVGDKILEGLGNNTRWVFEVAASTNEKVEIKLLDFHGKKGFSPDVMSYHVTPLDDLAWSAKPVANDKGCTLTLRSAARGDSAPFRYKVCITVDVVCR